MIKLIIADDHALVRKGIVRILQLEDDLNFEFIDEAGSGEELLDKARRKKYDIIVLDLSMPGIGGLDALKAIRNEHPDVPVLILSTYSEEQYAIRVLRAGAAGYVRKTNSPDDLIEAIKKLSTGQKYFSHVVAEKILSYGNDKLPHEELSDREFQVLRMIAIGKTQKSISDELCLSIKTINTYRKRILDKLKMKNNNEIAEYCIVNQLID